MTKQRSFVLGAGLLFGTGIAVRLHNATHYPPDWGFDASYNWQYIYRLTRSWALPRPDAGWATGDPPFYFYLSGLVARAVESVSSMSPVLVAIPLLSTLAGLATVALAVAFVRRVHPDEPRRALLAGALLLFLPAHIYMSAMVNEEMLASLLVSLVLFALARPGLADPDAPHPWRLAAAAGLAAGLAILTKLTGVLVLGAAGLAYAVDGWRRQALAPAASRLAVFGLAPAASRLAVFGLVAVVVGGWWYVRNRVEYGYFQPYAMPAHQLMFSMPPGERGVADYLRVPLATWSDPQLLNPDLLASVWGSTYATVWFDGHRFFLPRDHDGVSRLGTATLLLALLPTAAFAVGVAGGLQRLRQGRRERDAVDVPLLAITFLTLAGYAVYTWRNPWFAVVKGTSLLGLSLPFAYYASDALTRWTGRRGPLSWLCWGVLAALAAAALASSTFNGVFEKTEISGLSWGGPERP